MTTMSISPKWIEGPLASVLCQLGDRYGLDPVDLWEYSQEDGVQGWDDGAGPWLAGSIYGLEGQILYALVRALKPDWVVQIGGWMGCSATHIGMALKANQQGRLSAVDINPNQCSQLWAEARPYVDLITSDGVAFLHSQADQTIDLLFEDAEHTVALTQALVEAALPKLAPGGFIINHDAGHYRVGADVRQALEQAGWDYDIYKPEPAQCGLAIGQIENE